MKVSIFKRKQSLRELMANDLAANELAKGALRLAIAGHNHLVISRLVGLPA